MNALLNDILSVIVVFNMSLLMFFIIKILWGMRKDVF